MTIKKPQDVTDVVLNSKKPTPYWKKEKIQQFTRDRQDEVSSVIDFVGDIRNSSVTSVAIIIELAFVAGTVALVLKSCS
jgi:hypothetical protein